LTYGHVKFDKELRIMSSGAFSDSKYISNAGDVYPVRIQPETLGLTLDAVANAAPTPAVDQVIRAKVSGSRRSYGVHCRTVTVQFTAAKTDYVANAKITVPWLTGSTWETLPPGATGTYLGTAVKLVGKSPERIK
jgi:hypothetical protein